LASRPEVLGVEAVGEGRWSRGKEYIVSVHEIAFFVFWVVFEDKSSIWPIAGFNII